MTAASLFQRFQRDFLGTPATGRDRVYLDAAATSLMPAFVLQGLAAYYQNACANPHTEAHLQGMATTAAIEDSRDAVAGLFGASSPDWVTLFVGQGATAALNRALRVVMDRRGRRDVLLVSSMEHHSNMLPWIERSGSRVLLLPHNLDGSLDLRSLRSMVAANGHRVAAVIATLASNVTGAVTPAAELASIAHSVGAICVVDAAQAAPHIPIDVSSSGVDLMAMSGHKFFAPGSPGVLIGKRGLFTDALYGDVGGGTVDNVDPNGAATYAARVESREEAGTPNVPGSISLGMVADVVSRFGMGMIEAHDRELTGRLLAALRADPNRFVVYGSDAPGGIPRTGTVAFNLRSVPHGLVAAALSDEYAIAVRNHCFCAQPYVKSLLDTHPRVAFGRGPHAPVRPGMVRASLGPWNTAADIDRLVLALHRIDADADALCRRYAPSPDGSWHAGDRPSPRACFSIRSASRAF